MSEEKEAIGDDLTDDIFSKAVVIAESKYKVTRMPESHLPLAKTIAKAYYKLMKQYEMKMLG